MGDLIELSDYISDDSSFYGDDNTQEELEDRINALDIEAYWSSHPKEINVRAANSSKSKNVIRTETGTSPIRKVDEKLDINAARKSFAREPFNPREGEMDSKQLGETVDDFIRRLPIRGSFQVGPWLWAANPYAERDAKPDNQDPEFLQRGHRLMQEYLELKSSLAASEPGLAPSTITRRLTGDREKLKRNILSLAQKNGLTSGKWMLFPSETHAEKIWRKVVDAVVNNELGTACKIATDGDTRLICCYTKDFSNLDDVRRVVQAMADLGLTPTDASRGIYYKCDAFTLLDIASGNEYGIPASLYSSRDILNSPQGEHSSRPEGKQGRMIKPSSNLRKPRQGR